MNASSRLCLSSLLSAAALSAQGSDFLFSVSQPEFTLSGSGGTGMQNLFPNEILGLHAVPCPMMTEKWAPRSCFMTMAGDENGNGAYWNPNILGSIDALMTAPSAAGGMNNQRNVFYSPSQPLGNAVSGAPGLRPGDIGRIVRTGAGDGRIEYFIRAEQIQIALGLPAAPVVIDVDAAVYSPNFGLFLSLDADIVINPCTGPVLLRDGDVFVIPPVSYTLAANQTIAAVAPGSALVAITEAALDAMVVNANVTNNVGMCLVNSVDLESLDIDWSAPPPFSVPTCAGVVAWIPHFLFSTETMRGGAILTTKGGGQIAPSGCGLLGTPCGGGATLGNQIGLRPPTAATGISSYVNALASTRLFDFESEAATPVIPVGNSAVVDFHSPGAMTWVFLTFAPAGVGAVAPTAPFGFGFLGFPDFYPVLNFMGAIPTGTGFGTYTSPAIPFPCKLVFSGVTISSAGSVEISTPTMVEVF